MNITSLLQQKANINELMTQRMRDDADEIIRLADAMAEAATCVRGQGYNSFIAAREHFLKTVHQIHEDYSQIGKNF